MLAVAEVVAVEEAELLLVDGSRRLQVLVLSGRKLRKPTAVAAARGMYRFY